MLLDLYNWTKNMHNGDATISKVELVVSDIPEDYQNRVEPLFILRNILLARYSPMGNMHDSNVQLELFIMSFNLFNQLPLMCIRIARSAICIYVFMKNWDNASLLGHAVVKLLFLVYRCYLSRKDQ